MPPRFSFLPPDLFLAPPRYFFGRKKLFFLAGKNVEICDFRQKKPSDFGEDFLFSFFFFGDHLVLAGKFAISARKSLRTSAKNFFLEITCFWPEKNAKILARKGLRKSAKTFAPPDFNFAPPRSHEAGDAPERITSFNIKGPEESDKLIYAEKNLQCSRWRIACRLAFVMNFRKSSATCFQTASWQKKWSWKDKNLTNHER